MCDPSVRVFPVRGSGRAARHRGTYRNRTTYFPTFRRGVRSGVYRECRIDPTAERPVVAFARFETVTRRFMPAKPKAKAFELAGKAPRYRAWYFSTR